MASLTDILRGHPAQSWERTQARATLQFPWCWPADAELSSAARRLTGHDRPEPIAGEVCLASVDADRASLWRWTPQRDAWGVMGRELVADAKDAHARAWALASSHAPVIVRPSFLERPPQARAVPIATGGEWALTGSSFGLALALSAVSQLLDIPVPANVVALAAFGAEGKTERVDARGLERKLRALHEHALGMRRVLVHPSQVAEAERQCGPGVTVHALGSLIDAIDVVWPDAVTTTRDRWRDTAQASSVNERLYRMALENSPFVTDWRPVARTATLLRELLVTDPVKAEKARFAQEVAERHIGHIAESLGWVVARRDGHVAQHADRLRVLAHNVQSVVDAGTTSVECAAAAESALREVAAPDRRHHADAELLGAIGRAFAAAGELPRSVDALTQAVAHWKECDRADDAARPLCELVRVLGSVGKPELERVLAVDVAWVRQPDRALSDVSATFIAVAVGRALVTQDHAHRGVAELASQGVPWARALPHVQRARLRWLARGLAQLGRHEEARQRRQELEHCHSDSADANGELALLDAALESGLEAAALLERLLTGPGGLEFQRLSAEARAIAPELSSAGLAWFFSDRYRY